MAGRDRGCLGRPVRALHDGAEGFAGLLDERRRHARPARGDEAQRPHPLGAEARRRHQGDEERRRPDHEGDAFGLDELQRMFGIPPLHQNGPHARDPREEHAVEEAGDVGQRRRHEDGVVRAESVDIAHELRLVGQAPLGVEHGLRRPRRARGEEGDSEIARAGSRRVRSDWSALSEQPVDVGRGGEHEPGLDLGQGGRRFGRPRAVVHGDGDRTEAPAGPVEKDDLLDVVQLPGHGVAAPDTASSQAAGQAGHVLLDVAAPRRGQDGVERRHVPRTARAEVVGGSCRPQRGS